MAPKGACRTLGHQGNTLGWPPYRLLAGSMLCWAMGRHPLGAQGLLLSLRDQCRGALCCSTSFLMTCRRALSLPLRKLVRTARGMGGSVVCWRLGRLCRGIWPVWLRGPGAAAGAARRIQGPVLLPLGHKKLLKLQAPPPFLAGLFVLLQLEQLLAPRPGARPFHCWAACSRATLD